MELVGYLGVTIPVENAPSLEISLRKHLPLDLAVNIAHVLLNVESIWSTRRPRSHEKFARSVLEASELLRLLVKLQIPQLLLLNALLVLLEVLHQVFDFLDFGFGIGVQDHCKIFH